MPIDPKTDSAGPRATSEQRNKAAMIAYLAKQAVASDEESSLLDQSPLLSSATSSSRRDALRDLITQNKVRP